MTELQLYKYIQDNAVEWHWNDNNGTPDVLIMPYAWHIQEFCKMIGQYSIDREVMAFLKPAYVCVWMREICEFYDIELENVFPKDHE